MFGSEELSEDNIVSMVNESQTQGILGTDEATMINNIFELNDKEAKDIMTNRSQIVGLDSNTPLGDAIETILNESYSRYPVYDENLDHIIGILHLKDAVRFQHGNKKRVGSLKKYPEILRPVRFIPETVKIDDLFAAMQADKLQMVVIIDEYGQTSGLVAMEDILEEIVGNLTDEYDTEEQFIDQKEDDTYEIGGLTKLSDLEEQLSIEFDTEDYETLNGFIISKLEHVPVPETDEGFSFEYQGFVFKILKVENRIIQSVLVVKEDINSQVESTVEDET